MTVRHRFVIGVVVALVVVSTMPVPVAAAEDPRFETIVPEPRLTPGAEQVLTVQLTNDAAEVDDRVSTASNVHVEAIAGDTPFEVRSGPQKVGTMADGVTASVPIRLLVPMDAPAGTYDLPLRVTYEYDTDERETTTVRARVRVPEHPVFEVEGVSSSLTVGEQGTARVLVQNNGSATAFETMFAVQSPSTAVTLDGAQSSSHYLGDWMPGENRSLTVDLTASTNAAPRTYPLSITPTYEDAASIQTTQPSFTVSVQPAARQTFAVSDVSVTPYSDTVAVGHFSITNTGNRTVENALAEITSSSPNVRVVDATTTQGTLEPGASTPVSIELRIAPDAAAGPRQFSAIVQYERDDGPMYEAEPVTFQAPISTNANVLQLTPVNNTFGIDESNRFVVEVTNTGNERVTDVHAQLMASAPYTSDAPSSYVGSLDPGESATLHFEVTTPEDALETTDAIPIVVNASTESDQSVSTGPTLVPITIETVESPTGGSTSILIGAIVVVFALLAGWWWLNR